MSALRAAVVVGTRHGHTTERRSLGLRHGCHAQPAGKDPRGRKVYAESPQPGRAQVLTEDEERAYKKGFEAGYLKGTKVNVSVTGTVGEDYVPFDQLQAEPITRSIVKGLVWRVFSTFTTLSIAVLTFKGSVDMETALKFGGLEFSMKFVAYFLHERLWTMIR